MASFACGGLAAAVKMLPYMAYRHHGEGAVAWCIRRPRREGDEASARNLPARCAGAMARLPHGMAAQYGVKRRESDFLPAMYMKASVKHPANNEIS